MKRLDGYHACMHANPSPLDDVLGSVRFGSFVTRES